MHWENENALQYIIVHYKLSDQICENWRDIGLIAS